MRYEQPIPFYMAYPFLLPLDQEQAQEKDLQVMKSFYSRRAARIQEKADRECDRMEYDGSMMFDEYPDKFMMEHLCRKIEQEVLKEEEGNMSVLIIEETCHGTVNTAGSTNSEAVKLANAYMKKYYSDAAGKYNLCIASKAYVNNVDRFQWSSGSMRDPDGLRNMTAAQVLEKLIGLQ